MKRRGVVYLNGRYVPEDKALVSVFDRGFTYGDGLFETMKASSCSVAFKKEHLARLKKGIRALRISLTSVEPLFSDISDGALETLLEKNRLNTAPASLRISVTRGVGKGQGHAPSSSCRPTTVITAKLIDAKAIALCQKQGVNAVYITGVAPLLTGIKSLNFLPNVLGKGEAIRRGAVEGIFIGKDGLISEGTSTNVFIVKDKVLQTPPSGLIADGHAALPGVIRAKVCQAAMRLGIRVRVSPIRASDLEEADEAFLTNSILEVVPLIRIEKKPVSNAMRGALTALIQKQMGLT